MIQTAHLFARLDGLLMDLLRSLSPEDWEAPTIARLWKVKDVVAHLLDGNLRTLSIQRDHHFGEPPPALEGYSDLVDWLNTLNADWVKACRRLSPSVLILLHEATGKCVSDYFSSLDPQAPAIFPVAWAGEKTSLNWMHVAREYSEKWLHQQQIRDAVNRPGLMNQEFFDPLMNTFVQALPYTFREVEAVEGTIVSLQIGEGLGGAWSLQKREAGWKLVDNGHAAQATVVLDADTAWKLFSKSIRPSAVKEKIYIQGDKRLGLHLLEMVSVMA